MMPRPFLIFLVMCVALASAACRRAEEQVRVIAPTATVTPFSTPLPDIATSVPVGAENNPIQVIVRSSSGSASTRSAITALEASLAETTGLAIKVLVVDRYAEAIAALCDSVDGTVSVAWLDGLSYAAAYAQGCGDAGLQIERGSGRAARTGEVVQLLSKASLNLERVSDLNNRTFCRIGYEDMYSWLIASLMVQSGGLKPLYDFKAIDEYADATELLEALTDGTCDAAAVTEADVDASPSSVRSAVKVLDESAEIPYAVLVYPPQIALGAQVALDQAFMSLQGDSALRDLLRADAVIKANADALRDVRDFAEGAGLDLAAIGG